jgi:murein DD-endopeptidase MepM/ murein hydrolase activator NlpD
VEDPALDGPLTQEQWGNAATIVHVGQTRQVPPYGWVVAIATALQESNLVNLGDLGARNDHDSLGLFQQRPSQGWGTPEQVMDPVYAAGKFYEALVAVPGWQNLPITVAAQRVQKSAYPDAYAKQATRASVIVRTLTGACVLVGGSGWVAPVQAPIVSGFRTSDRPDHDGVDLAAARGTPIRAASAGVVVTVTCNASTSDGQPFSCDRDGSLSIAGCGWYVEILHADRIVTRYCHQLRAPLVRVGQNVVAGQVIGVVGTSGNSSGPHLHFEVHSDYPSNSENAENPVAFMSAHGVNLGIE